MIEYLAYGGGQATVAACVLIVREILPRPDRIIAADTGRENPSTWEYLEIHIRPLVRSIGLDVEIAPHGLATVDLYGHNGDLLLPVYTATGKLSAFCSNEWKTYVCQRHLRNQGVEGALSWIGFTVDESTRIKARDKSPKWPTRYPLAELCLSKANCVEIIERYGLPVPPPSSCFMCPHKRNAEWRMIRDRYPDAFAEACRLDAEIREEDLARGNSGVWLHRSRVPLKEADLDASDPKDGKQCTFGVCFV
jgi:hypothetical protein